MVLRMTATRTIPILIVLNVVVASLLLVMLLATPVVQDAEEELGIRSVPVHYIYR